MSPLGTCLCMVISILVISKNSCCTSSVDIIVSPEAVSISSGTLYLDSAINITCKATADRGTIESLIPFYIINGSYIQHYCVGSPEYHQISQRFSILSYYYIYISDQVVFTTTISLSPISPLDNGLEVGCCFYNLQTEQHDISETRTINVTIFTTPPPTTTSTQTTLVSLPNELSNSTPSILTTFPITNTFSNSTVSDSPTVSLESSETFIKSQEFYITIGAFSTVVFILVILILVLIIVQITRQKRQIQFVPAPNAPIPVPAPAEAERVQAELNAIRFAEL